MEVSNIHTGVVGTSAGGPRGVVIRQMGDRLWEIRFSDDEQVYAGTTLGGALDKAIAYRKDAKLEIGDVARAQTTHLIEHLMGVRR